MNSNTSKVKKEKTPVAKVAKIDIISGLAAGLVVGIAGGSVSGCQGIELLAAIGFSLIVCLLVSIIKPYKSITKKLFSNEKFEIDEDDHKGRIITAALASAYSSVIISIGIVSVIVSVQNSSIDTIVDAYEVQIASVQAQIDVLTSENEKVYQDFCLVSDLVDKNKEEINGYDSRIKELETQKNAFEDEIITYNAEINVIQSKLTEKNEETGEKVEKWREEQNKRLNELNAQINATEEGIAEIDSRIAELDLKKSTAAQILNTNSASVEEKWTLYSDKLTAIQSLQDNMDSLCSTQLKYYYSKLTFNGLFAKTFLICLIAGLVAFAGVIYLREPVTDKIEEIRTSREEIMKKQREAEEDKKAEEERKAREAEEAVISEFKEKRQQNLNISQSENTISEGK